MQTFCDFKVMRALAKFKHVKKLEQNTLIEQYNQEVKMCREVSKMHVNDSNQGISTPIHPNPLRCQ